MHRINVPVYLAGAWQDEQTGGHFPAFLHKFRSSPQFYATMANGSHTESLSLGEFGRYADFLDLYVAPAGADRAQDASSRRSWRPSLTGVSGPALPPQQRLRRDDLRQAKQLYQSAAAHPGAVRGGRGQGRAVRAPRCRGSSTPSARGRRRARHRVRAYFLRPDGAPGDPAGPASSHAAVVLGRPVGAAARPTTPARAAPSGRPTRRTTGGRSRRAPAWAGSPRR